MSDSTKRVHCPKCSHPNTYDPQKGLKCANCYIHLSVEEYLAEVFKDLFHFLDLNVKYRVSKEKNTIGHYFVDKENTLSFEVVRQATILPLVKFASELPHKICIIVTEDQPYPSKCLFCGSPLRYETGPFNEPSIGCRGVNHIYYYQHPLNWAASVLGHIYPDWQFTTDTSDETISISRLKPVPAPEQTFFEKIQGIKKTGHLEVDLLPEKISFGSDGQTIAFWIPRNLQEKVGNVYGTINSLRVANLKAVLTND